MNLTLKRIVDTIKQGPVASMRQALAFFLGVEKSVNLAVGYQFFQFAAVGDFNAFTQKTD